MKGIYHLRGTVKHYDWGGFSFIPALLKTNNESNKPFAEYWMGTHPLGVSELQLPDGDTQKLTSRVKGLPYLFKVLDVKEMLSIQVHPSKSAAAIEFARENSEGIPLDAPERSYKDDNHKPELMVALGDFWLLHGFKPEKELLETLQRVPALNELLPVFKNGSYAALYKHVMEMAQEEVDRILSAWVKQVVTAYKKETLEKKNPDFWAARAAITFPNDAHIDRGIFSIYFFNLVYLQKGEGIFQDAGIPHAYLEGQNVELMANSDNVLRGGLTTKFIDVKELLKHVKCSPVVPAVLKPRLLSDHLYIYDTPVPDFQLQLLELDKGVSVALSASSPEILLLTEGLARLDSDIELKAGAPAAFVEQGASYSVTGKSGKVAVFKASVPNDDVK